MEQYASRAAWGEHWSIVEAQDSEGTTRGQAEASGESLSQMGRS